MACNTVDLCLLTYNHHGFNQGALHLRQLCEIGKYDIICIQEHWLTPDKLVYLKSFSNNYLVFGKSAMETTISAGFLRGRPFGGTSIMIKKQFSHIIKNVFTEDRFVILFLSDSCVFISVYMPVDDGTMESLNILIDILSSISNILDTFAQKFVFFAGDFKVNLSRKSKQSLLIQEFMCKFAIQPGDLIASTLVNCDNSTDNANNFFTFSNEKQGIFSKIDYICCSNALIGYMKSYCSVDSALNHSTVFQYPCYYLFLPPVIYSVCYPV